MRSIIQNVVLLLALGLAPTAVASVGVGGGGASTPPVGGGRGGDAPAVDPTQCWNNFLDALAQCSKAACLNPADPSTCNDILLQACVDGAQAVLRDCLGRREAR